MKIKLLIQIIIVSILSVSAYADGGRGVFIWPVYNPVSIPDSLQNESVFFIDNVKTIDFSDGGRTAVTVFQRIYINSEEAAEAYSQKEIFIGSNGYLSMIAARTIKANGDDVNLSEDQIIETYSITKNKYGKKTNRRVQFIYPGVQVGDVVDLAYSLELNSYIYSDLMYLEDELPSLYSRVTIRNMSLLDLTAYSLNNMPKMISKVEQGVRTVSWEKYGVNSIRNDYFNALAPDAPSFVFVLWKIGESLDYKTLYTFDLFNYPVTYGSFDLVTNYFVEKGVISREDEKFVKLKKIILSLENDFKWNKDKSTSIIKSTPGLLKEGLVDEVLYLRYLMKFLKEEGIKYERAFTKSLIDGRFEHGFVSLEQLTDRYLLIYDDQEHLHFIFPPKGENEFYYLDEIPYYNEGNQSITLFGKKDFLEEQGAVALPESRPSANVHRAKLLINFINGDSLKHSMQRRDVFTGHYSFLTRNSKGQSWLQELNVVQDSAEIEYSRLDSFYPYEVEFVQKEQELNLFKPIDDSLYWLQLSEILPKGIYQSDELNASWGKYLVLPFLKQTEISLFIKGETGISIAEEDKKLEFSNEIGSIKIEATQVDSNMLKFNYSISINKRYLSGDDEVSEYQKFLLKYADFKNKKWVIKFT